MLVHWNKWCVDQESDVPSIIFFIISSKILCKNRLNLFYECTKIKMKSFECPKSIRNYIKKNNAWNIRRLVDESFIPANQRTRVLYCRLSDLYLCWQSGWAKKGPKMCWRNNGWSLGYLRRENKEIAKEDGGRGHVKMGWKYI